MPDTPPELVTTGTFPRQYAIVRWTALGAAWVCFAVAMVVPAADLNAFTRWRGSPLGLGFHRWLFADLPAHMLSLFRRGELGYISPIDVVWWVAAIAATLMFLAAPLMLRRRLSSATILTLRYLALVLLVFPATLFLPVDLRFPQPRVGLWLLAAAHLLALVALWLPWPRKTMRATFFSVEPTAAPVPPA